MPWYEKHQFTPFETVAIDGLSYLNGDVLARRFHQLHLRGKKYPVVKFPSGLRREIWEAGREQGRALVQVFGAMELPLKGDRDDAYESATVIAEQYGYRVLRPHLDDLLVWLPGAGQHYRIRYENDRISDIALIEGEPDADTFPRSFELLDEQSRALLPELYANEVQGPEAVAPVKFFTPDSNWVWYPTEFDGQDIFFGLVSGFEVELGYFSLSELEQVRGPLGLPIERDFDFEPTVLDKLRRMHQSR